MSGTAPSFGLRFQVELDLRYVGAETLNTSFEEDSKTDKGLELVTTKSRSTVLACLACW